MRLLFFSLLAQSHAASLRQQPEKTNRAAKFIDRPDFSRQLGKADKASVTADLTASSSQQFLKTNHSKKACTPANTIFDLGFYDGGDSRAYLSSGYYCVVGVEADPDLVADAKKKFPLHLASGQLELLNVAVAPEGEATSWTEFYKSKCTKEWNSFYKSIGCRECAQPHSENPAMCTTVKVKATDCSSIFAQAGTPIYLKLDIEGAETGCFQAMAKFAGKPLPQYVSAEITQLEYIDTLYKLGYKGFKLVRQDVVNTVQAQSGPWGDGAMDCRTGGVWRTYQDIRQEFAVVLSKTLVPSEACPGGVMPIHGPPKPQYAYIWYDIHASLTAPPPPR